MLTHHNALALRSAKTLFTYSFRESEGIINYLKITIFITFLVCFCLLDK